MGWLAAPCQAVVESLAAVPDVWPGHLSACVASTDLLPSFGQGTPCPPVFGGRQLVFFLCGAVGANATLAWL